MYSQDNQDSTFAYLNGASARWLPQTISYQANNTNILQCPIASQLITTAPFNPFGGGPGSPGAGSARGAYLYGGFISSYSINGNFYADYAVGPQTFAKMTAVTSSSTTPLFVEGTWVEIFGPSGSSGCAHEQMFGDGNANSAFCGMTVDRHGGRTPAAGLRVFDSSYPGAANMTFTDGHAEFFKFRDIYNYTWSKNYSPPTTFPPLN